MRNLLYLFLLSVMLAGCRNNSVRCLEKAGTMLGVNYDSLQYYLQRIDSASLTPDQRCEYYCLKLSTSVYFHSLGRNKVDSISKLLMAHFRPEDPLAFRAGMIRADCYFGRNEFHASDSIIDLMKERIKTKKDSLSWFNYKFVLKYRMGDSDSSFYYLEQMLRYELTRKQYIYDRMGWLYAEIGQTDSAITYYKVAVKEDRTRGSFFYFDKVVDLFRKEKDYVKGLNAMHELRKYSKRSDVPYVNFLQGELNLELHRPDSALKYYRIASQSGNSFIASQAFSRMGDIMEGERNIEEAFRMYNKSNRNFNDVYGNVEMLERRVDFDALKLKNQLNELEMARQQHIIVILGMALFIALLTGSFILYILYRKRVMERKRLLQENVLLKQQEELSALREKEALLREQDARMREELFKRLKVFDKIPLSDREQPEGGMENGHIHLSDTDWGEIRLMLDSAYSGFTGKLKRDFPDLSERDVNFCCLVKINVSLQSLADIYCISKNSVSRRKLRLKEKMGIEEGKTLDEFLHNY